MVAFKKIKKRSENWIVRKADNLFGYGDGDTIYISFWKFHPIVEFGHLSLMRVVEIRKKFESNYSGDGNMNNNLFPIFTILKYTYQPDSTLMEEGPMQNQTLLLYLNLNTDKLTLGLC